MKRLYLPSADSPVIDWLIFITFLLLVCLCIGGFVIWLKVVKANTSKRKRRKRHHHRPTNPTLAQTGGLPAKRDPNQLPPGP
jgi:uncharacterized iron-regulated membrane protein